MEVKSARENPELFRIFLKEIVKNVAATASSEKSETEKDYRFIELFIQDRFKQTVNNFIDVMWESFDIESKSKHLYELQKQFPPDYVAWRPTAGVVPIKTLQGAHLTNLKHKLTEKISNNSEKIDTLKEVLLTKLSSIEKSHKEIINNEKLIEQIYKDYQQIVNFF